jgi:GNAT superfamily N-acetyltransferase
MVEIRRITVDEAFGVRELVRRATDELAQRSPEDDIGIAEQGLENLETQFRLGAVHEDEATFVAAEGERLVGFVAAWITRGRATPGVAGTIDWLWVEPRSDRDALRTELATTAIEWLRQRGARTIIHEEDADHPDRDPWEGLGFAGDVTRFSLYD